jgi:imidazolonepropionase-like amidohydrolase
MKIRLVKLITLIVLLAATAGCGTPVERSDVLITNARLIDGTGRVQEGAMIAISGDRIEGVFSEGELREGDLTIDAAGRTVMPGLIDSHVHVIVDDQIVDQATLAEHIETSVKRNLAGYLAHGVTTVKSTGDPEDAILELRQLIEEGKIEGPRLLAVGPVLSAPGGHPSVTVFADNPWIRERAVEELESVEGAKETILRLAAKGVDGIKIVYQGSDNDSEIYFYEDGVSIRRLSREVMESIIEESHRHGLFVTAHTFEEEGVIPVVEAGVDSLEHGVVAKTPVSEPVIEMLREAGVFYIPTLQVFRETEKRERAMANLKQLSEAGVRIVLGTDTVGNTPAGANTIREAERMVEAGMSPAQVIQAATLNAAEHLGRGDDLGTVETGKLADLIIVEGDPLESISVLRTPWVVLKGGQVVVDNRQE